MNVDLTSETTEKLMKKQLEECPTMLSVVNGAKPTQETWAMLRGIFRKPRFKFRTKRDDTSSCRSIQVRKIRLGVTCRANVTTGNLVEEYGHFFIIQIFGRANFDFWTV